MTSIDRERLRERFAAEQQCFIATNPRSAELSSQAGAHLLTGVSMAWMTRWPGSFPIFSARLTAPV
jgi:glutamate-1-semialdehyde 2,1-aminomutase